MRRAIGLGLVVLAAAAVLSGLDRAGEREALVVRSRLGGSPRVLRAGTHWNPPLLSEKARYPLGPTSLAIFLDPGRITSSEGEPVGFDVTVTLELDPDRLAEVHDEVGPELTRVLTEDVSRRLIETLDGLPLKDLYLVRWTEAGDEVTRSMRPTRMGQLAGLGSVTVDRAHLDPKVERRLVRDLGRAGDQRVMILGIDGADWNILRPMLGRGELPHLGRLVADGVRAELESIRPLLSPLIWTSIVTGKRPDKHGILDFFAEDPATGRQVPVTSNLRRAQALWNMCSDLEMEVCFVDWLASWPAEPVEGVIVSDRLAYHAFDPSPDHYETHGRTYPEDLTGDLLPLVRRDRDVTFDEIRRFLRIERREFSALADGHYNPGDPVQNFRLVYATTETYRRIGLELARRPSRLFGVYFELLDAVSHLFVKHMDPAMGDVPPAEARAFGHAVEESYRYQDEILGEFLEFCDERTTVIVLSDHGFRSGPLRLASRSQIHAEGGAAADWHRPDGVLVMRGPHIRRGVEIEHASVLDITPTVLYLLGLPVASDMDGGVLTEAIDPDYLSNSPVLRIATYESGRPGGGQGPIASPDDDALRERLAALGYVDGESPNARRNLAQVYVERGEFEKAVAEYRRALELRPKSPRLWNNLGMVYLRMEAYADAIAPLNRALELEPDFEPALSNLAVAYTHLGRLEEAGRVMERVVEIEPARAEYHDNLGVIYTRLGRTERALECFRRAASLEPRFPEPYNNRGAVAMELGRYDEARSSFVRALRCRPGFFDAQYNLGLLEMRLEDYPAALSALRTAVDLRPRHPGAHYQLGEAYWRLGRKDDALSEWRTTVVLDPEGPEGARASERLDG